ncbi:MAG TPA: hypothetical protein VES03_06115 [Motilibacterales bacterium]|nr:hypothetical protein [Motilibacterales bacterium]
MIHRTAAVIALMAGMTGCTAPAPISDPVAQPSPEFPAAPLARTAVESELDCYLITNASYSAGRGATEQDSVAALAGWYPSITRTTRWDGGPLRPPASSGTESETTTEQPADATSDEPAETAGSTWLLFATDGHGYGTATTSQLDPAVAEWTATVDTLCIAVMPPSPAEYSDLTLEGRPRDESIQDPRNAGFRRAMDDSILSLPEGAAADALKAVGWRVRVDERDGVAQFQAGTSSSWINLAITNGTVIGYSIG